MKVTVSLIIKSTSTNKQCDHFIFLDQLRSDEEEKSTKKKENIVI